MYSEINDDWGTIGFTGDSFMMMNQRNAVRATQPEGPWVEVTDHDCGDHVREGGGGGVGPGIMMGNCGSLYTTDRGQTWNRASACSSVTDFGGIGHRGGFAFGDGLFVAVDAQGDFCSTANLGSTWRNGSISNFRDGPIAELGKVFFANGEHWAMVGPIGHSTTDGVNWSTTEFLPRNTGIMLHAIASSDTGAYVAFDRVTGQFYRSTDAETWTKTTKRSSSPQFQRLLFGYGKASSECPAE
jgi:photosystem II stability/assembly factor-like uncharacterized protein